MEAYLDDFNLITIITNKKSPNVFSLDGAVLKNIDYKDLADLDKYICSYDGLIELHKRHYVNGCLLKIGKIVRSPQFDELFNYTGPLGYEYHQEHTIFRIYSPVAKEIQIYIGKIYDLEYLGQGLWEVKIMGNLVNQAYHYLVCVNDEIKKTFDPYGLMADKESNYVIDLTNIYQSKYSRPKMTTDPIIYEANIRDFSINFASDKKGTYLGFIEDQKINDIFIGLKHIKNLGFSHIQLMPTIMFGGIDKGYNWGYNPIHFFVNSEYFMLENRINEFKQMIDVIHQSNMRVILDVVYNHVYHADKFPYEILVPGYSYHYDESGYLTSVSGCENDLNSERKMIRRMIIDSCKYFSNTFNIDGFRFDLMGLLDIELMNEIKSSFPEDYLIYGEGWNMPSNLEETKRASMINHNKMPDIAHFNDYFRNSMRGSNGSSELGFAYGMDIDINDILLGSEHNFGKGFKGINYVECHDNLTFYDKMISLIESDKNYQRLANALVILAKGIPFIHCGQEFLRTKKGIENSYNSSDDINMVNWQRCIDNYDVVIEMKNLIKLRKEMDYQKLSITKIDNLWKMDFINYQVYFKNNYNEQTIHNVVIKDVGVYVFKEGKQWSLME